MHIKHIIHCMWYTDAHTGAHTQYVVFEIKRRYSINDAAGGGVMEIMIMIMIMIMMGLDIQCYVYVHVLTWTVLINISGNVLMKSLTYRNIS